MPLACTSALSWARVWSNPFALRRRKTPSALGAAAGCSAKAGMAIPVEARAAAARID
jgi:hypothetical protein